VPSRTLAQCLLAKHRRITRPSSDSCRRPSFGPESALQHHHPG